MASSDKELEEQLMAAGNKLLDPPSSVDELLPLLDQVETCLSRVEQSPSKSMQIALSPSQKALVADKLFRHSDVDVKVAVASCISEITRISAPEAPYDDDQMKEVFQLIVGSFENLSDKSSRSYGKRASILETVAKVRSCVVMLDLECDAMILEMFQHFLKELRDYHPDNVFSSMETIMTLVIEESEDISPELLSPVLATVKKDNKEGLPIARKLADKVLENCEAKLRPYLCQALKSLGLLPGDYSRVVASICQDTNGVVEQNNVNGISMEKESLPEQSLPEGNSLSDVPASCGSPKTVVSNGLTQMGKDNSLPEPMSVNEEGDGQESTALESNNTSINGDLEKLDTENMAKEESNPEQPTKKRGRKASSSMKSAKPSNNTQVDDKDAEMVEDSPNEHGNDPPSLPNENPSGGENLASVSEKEPVTDASSPRATGDESEVAALPSESKDVPDESQSQQAGSSKEKEDSTEEAKASSEGISEKDSGGKGDLEAKTDAGKGDDTTDDLSSKEKTVAMEETYKENDATSGSGAKALKKPEKKAKASTASGEGTSNKKPAEKKQQTKGTPASEKSAKKSHGKDDKEKLSVSKLVKKPSKDEPQSGEISKENSKRKRISGKEEGSDIKHYGAELIGSKIEVWWPLDKQFYAGVVDAFDAAKKRHKVVYSDGDVEVLNLREEKWNLIESDSGDKGKGADQEGSDASAEMPQKKKAKMKPGLSSTKQGKLEISSKRSGGTSSGKSKAVAAAMSGQKSREGNRADGKLKYDMSPKNTDKSTSKKSAKSKDTDLTTLKSGKSKGNDSGARSVTIKSERETQKSGKFKSDIKSTLKGKSTRPGKSSTKITEKPKLGLSKPRESEDAEDSEDSSEVPESNKAKLPEPSKTKGSRLSTGKKRRRGA